VGVVAIAVCLALQEWQPMSGRAWLAILVTALGPWSTGYMLWEMALHHTSSIRLGLMAAGTPVLSTLWLIGLFAHTNPGSVNREQTLLLCAAALMISAGVALAMWKGAANK
jgi:drug/metabolite transporter (DMT)-like permease